MPLYISPPAVAEAVALELEGIASYRDINDIIIRDTNAGFLKADPQFENCIIEIAPDEPPFSDTAMLGGYCKYDYFYKIAIRAKPKYLTKLKSIYGSEEEGMWNLFKEVNKKIGKTNLSGVIDYPENNAISNISFGIDTNEGILQFDWTARILSPEMS